MSELEKTFAELREKKMSDEDITREVFRQNLDTDINELLKITGFDKLKIGRMKGQVSRTIRKEEKSIEEKEKPLEEKGAGAPPKSIYKTAEDVNELLKDLLENSPGIKPEHVKEVMWWGEQYGSLHPTTVAYILGGLRGVDSRTANMVSQKYSVALFKLQRETGAMPPLYGGLQPQQQPMFGLPPQLTAQSPQQFPQQPPTGQPQVSGYQPPAAGFYSQQDVERMKQDWAKEGRLKGLEDQLDRLRQELPDIIKKSMPSSTESADYEEVQEYVDKKGNIVDPNDAVSVRTIKRPSRGVSQESSGMSRLEKHVETLEKSLKDQQLESLKGTLKEVQDSVKNLASGKGKGEDSEAVQTLKVTLEKYEGKFEALKDAMATRDRERLEGTITGLQESMRGLQNQIGTIRAGGVTTSEGVIATGITELGKREPLKIVVEGVKSLTAPGISLPPTEGEIGRQPSGVVRGLKPFGLVEVIRERQQK